MMMQNNEEEIEIMYFSAQSPRDGSTIFERRIHLTKSQRKELDDKAEEYSTEFKRIFDTLCPQFDVRLSVIGDWLKGKNKPIPEKKEFLNWFISEKIGSFSFGFENYEDSESGQIVEKTTISITDFTQCFVPSLIDDYLLEFCKQYAGKLERIDLQLSTPEPEKIVKVKVKIPTFIVMLEVAETINTVEKFLPLTWINGTDKLAKYKKAIFDKFGYVYAESTIKNKISENLTDTQRLKVVKMLNEYGRMDLAKQYQIQYKCTA